MELALLVPTMTSANMPAPSELMAQRPKLGKYNGCSPQHAQKIPVMATHATSAKEIKVTMMTDPGLRYGFSRVASHDKFADAMPASMKQGASAANVTMKRVNAIQRRAFLPDLPCSIVSTPSNSAYSAAVRGTFSVTAGIDVGFEGLAGFIESTSGMSSATSAYALPLLADGSEAFILAFARRNGLYPGSVWKKQLRAMGRMGLGSLFYSNRRERNSHGGPTPNVQRALPISAAAGRCCGPLAH